MGSLCGCFSGIMEVSTNIVPVSEGIESEGTPLVSSLDTQSMGPHVSPSVDSDWSTREPFSPTETDWYDEMWGRQWRGRRSPWSLMERQYEFSIDMNGYEYKWKNDWNSSSAESMEWWSDLESNWRWNVRKTKVNQRDKWWREIYLTLKEDPETAKIYPPKLEQEKDKKCTSLF